MRKNIAAKIDEYEKDGEIKGRYVNIGVILPGEKGEYILLDPTINLSGVLQKQNMLASKKLKAGGNAKIGTSVICSIFTNDAPAQQQQQAPQQQQQQSPPPQADGFDDDIPF